MQKVSIIIPVYNIEEYLKECLESVINQTLKDIEIILIDDGSTDNSGKICDEYKEKDERIKVIHQKNQGVSIARNKGIDIANGEYIYFIDSDDYLINNDFLQNAYNTAIQKNSDLVIVGLNTFYVKNFKIKDITNLYTWNCFVKKEFFEQNKEVRFPENMHFSEDAIFSFKLLLLVEKISKNDNTKYFYRKRKGQATENKIELKKTIIEILKETENFYNKHGFWNKKTDELILFTVEHNFKLFIEKNIDLKEKIETKNLIKNFLKKHNLTAFKFLKYKKGLYLFIFCSFPYILLDIAFTFYYLILFFIRKIYGKNVIINYNYLRRKHN